MPRHPPPARPSDPPIPPSDAGTRPPCWLRWCRRLHLCARCVCLAAALFAGPLLYLWIAGLPGPIANRLLRRLDAHPFLVTAERLGISPRGNLIAHQVLIYPDDSFAEPILGLEECVVRPNFAALLRGRLEPSRLRIESGFILFPPWTRTSSPRADARLHLTGLRADLRPSLDRIDIVFASARCHALDLHAAGSLAGLQTRAPGGARIADHLAAAIDAIRQSPALLPSFVNALADTETDGPLTLRLEIGGSVTGATVAAVLEGEQFSLGGQRIDRVSGRASWRDGLLHIESIRARGPDGLRFELQAEPAPPTNLPAGLVGMFAFDRFILRGVRFANGSGHFSSEDGRLHLRDCATRIGAEGERGTAAATLVWDPIEDTLAGDLDLALDPNDFAPFLNSNQLRIARRFGFERERPHFTGSFRRTTRPETNITVAGRLSADSFTYRGVAIDSMQADLVHTGDTIRLDGWRFARPEGVTTGSLVVPLHQRDIHVSLDSTMHPVAIAGMVSPRLHQAVSLWRFDGPVAMRARGMVDGSGLEEITDLVLEVDGRRMGRGRWIADEAQFTLHAYHGVYATTNLTGRAYDGTFQGTVRVEPLPAGPEHRFIVRATLADADFARIALAYAEAGEAPPSGRVHLTLQVTGLVSDAFGPVTRGSGSLFIKDGAVFRTRLFGGLSELLSRLVPGLGFVAQTDMACTFRIEESAVFSDDIRLEGDVISMRAEGEIEFDGQARMRVEVQLLRRGPVAALLRLLTMPVTKLFEFRMTGTLDDPKWRPINLPKELFLIFD